MLPPVWALVGALASADRQVTNLSCEVGTGAVEVPQFLASKKFERLPVGSVVPSGWLLEQLLLQSNSLAGYLSDSTFPGADHVNTSLWSGGNGSKMGGTYQWLPYWTNGQVPLLGLVEAANATSRVESNMGSIIDTMMDYVLAHTNKTNGWIGPFIDEPGDNNGHGLWDPLNMIRSLFMFAEFRPEKEAAVAKAVVAHLTEEGKLLVTDPVLKWAQTRWPTYVEICQYVIDIYIPKYGDAIGPLGAKGTTEMLLKSSALFAARGMNWLEYYNRNGSIKFPFADVHNWNTNDHGVNNAEGAVRWPAVTYRMTGRQADADQMDVLLHMLDTYQGQVQSLLCADEVFCGRAPHRGTETCTEVEAMASLEFAYEVLGQVEGQNLWDRIERMAFNAMPAALTADMWTHVYVQNANSVFAGHTGPKDNDDTQPLQAHGLHHQHQTGKTCGRCGGRAVGSGDGDGGQAQHNHAQLGDKPSGEDQSANYYGVSHFPCCITNFPQGWPKFAQHVFYTQRASGGSPAAVVVASLVASSATLPAWLGGGAHIATDSKYPFGDNATVTVTASKSLVARIRIPAWATKATINGKAAPNGTLVNIACAGGSNPTVIKIELNPEVVLEKGWGELAVLAGPSIEYAAGGATVPSDPSNTSLFTTGGGAALMRSKVPGCTDVRTGSPGANSTLTLSSQLSGEGHFVESISLSFKYIAGYSPSPNHPKKPPQVQVVFVDGSTSAEVATVWTSPPLGNYSFDHYTGYSPFINVSVTGLKIPNSKQLMVQLKFINNQRNLQVQMQPKLGLDVKVGWTAAAAPGPHPPPSKYVRAATDGVAITRGPLVFALHPHEEVSIVKNYTQMLPTRPLAVDYEIGTSDMWNYAIDTSTPPKFVATPSSKWSLDFPFGGDQGPSTQEYPFSVEVQASALPSWGYWEGSKITDNLPPSPVTVSGAKMTTLKLTPFGLTNIRIAVFPWSK